MVNPGATVTANASSPRRTLVVVRGTALVARGNEEFILAENGSIYISIDVQHRLENSGKMPLEIIEAQSSTYLGEDDIVRFGDKYGRQ